MSIPPLLPLLIKLNKKLKRERWGEGHKKEKIIGII